MSQILKRFLFSLAIFTVFLLSAKPLGAFQQDDFQLGLLIDPVMVYATRTAIVLAILSILLLLYLMTFSKFSLRDSMSKMLMLVGLIIFPSMTVLIVNVVGLEHAKTVQFCNSCHKAMGKYIREIEDKQSTTIAARHYQNRWINYDQCYSCHTGYGIFGTLHAKLRGILDVYRYYSGTWSEPIKLAEEYKNKDCLKCHGFAKSFLEKEAHRPIFKSIRSDEILCKACHLPIHSK